MGRRVPETCSRVRSALAVAGALTAAIACGDPPANLTGQRPNVLLVLVDDLRPDLGAYGHPVVQTPGIDRLAASGVRFDRAYAQYPACNPSRTSLLTGLRPDTTGVLDNRTPYASRLPDVLTLPQLFRQNGYFTASVGKIFHGSGRSEEWIQSGVWDLDLSPRRGRRAPGEVAAEQGQVGRYVWRAATGGESELVDARVASRAIEVLEQIGDRSFFLAVGLTATHPHFEAPAGYFELYPMSSVRLPPASAPELAARLADLHGWSDEAAGSFTSEQKKELVRAYWACVSFVDTQVGRLVAALDRLDLSDRTVVVLTSDHGYHLGEQGWWSKHTLYEAATRVPLLVSWPGTVAAGQVAEGLVELVDLYPTLAELVGIEPSAALEGRSFVPLLEDPGRIWPEVALSQIALTGVDGRSVRTDRWRYIEWHGNRDLVELFDLGSEQTESVDLAGLAAHADDRQRLRALWR